MQSKESKMQNFFELNRLEPNKRGVVERLKDFDEIYEVFDESQVKGQSSRCVQCGDPYCLNKCPLSNYIPHWLKAGASKDLELAFKLSNQSSPFPEVMGRVCPQDRLCEGDCTLNDGYGAITIGSIETYISEEGFKQGMKPVLDTPKIGKKVAIIGGGPAGLSAATFLLRAGIDVEIFDKQHQAGGLLTYGIPGFKLDKHVVARRVKWLIEQGLVLHNNTEVGKDISIDEIMNNFDAVFIGVGATKGVKPKLKNSDSKDCYLAMDFLTNVQKKNFSESYDESIDVRGKNVVVIGGGDTAMDCLRTSLREGAASVKCLYRRDALNMPGSKKEYINAKEEGVDFVFNVSPKEIIVNDENKVIGVEIVKTKLTLDHGSARAKVEEIEGSNYQEGADIVIFALGFDTISYEFYAEAGIETGKWGEVIVDENYQTTTAGIYAGGDCIRGADLVVTAARDGRDAAYNIIKELKKIK